MTSAVLERPVESRPANGGAPARRAVMRWAWRLFRREWRQQLLVLALIIVAVAALFVAAAVATNNPTPRTRVSVAQRTSRPSRVRFPTSRQESPRSNVASVASK
ncbi:MAG: hypothetical protein ACLP1E_00490 [Acidimicrobiales bacterium]